MYAIRSYYDIQRITQQALDGGGILKLVAALAGTSGSWVGVSSPLDATPSGTITPIQLRLSR